MKTRRQFIYGYWFDHKGGQLHNHKKQNEISEKARLDKSPKTGTKRPETKQSSMISIVIHTKRSNDNSAANVVSLHK